MEETNYGILYKLRKTSSGRSEILHLVRDSHGILHTTGTTTGTDGSPQAAPVPQQPVYAVPVTVRQEEPISTGEYIGIFLLMIVPLVNLICLLIWACGGCKKVNKRNLARAMLVLILIVTVLTGLLVLAGGLLFGDMLNELKELSTQLEGISTR